MHNTHQQYLIKNVAAFAAGIAESLAVQHQHGTALHPDLAAEHKARIVLNLDNLKRQLAEVEPVLREENQ